MIRGKHQVTPCWVPTQRTYSLFHQIKSSALIRLIMSEPVYVSVIINLIGLIDSV